MQVLRIMKLAAYGETIPHEVIHLHTNYFVRDIAQRLWNCPRTACEALALGLIQIGL